MKVVAYLAIGSGALAMLYRLFLREPGIGIFMRLFMAVVFGFAVLAAVMIVGVVAHALVVAIGAFISTLVSDLR